MQQKIQVLRKVTDEESEQLFNARKAGFYDSYGDVWDLMHALEGKEYRLSVFNARWADGEVYPTVKLDTAVADTCFRTQQTGEGLYIAEGRPIMSPSEFSLHRYSLASEKSRNAAREYVRRKFSDLRARVIESQ